MTDLRLMLLIAGVIIIAWLYLVGRRRANDNIGRNNQFDVSIGKDEVVVPDDVMTQAAEDDQLKIQDSESILQADTFYDEDIVGEFSLHADDIDWDDMDDLDLEWLEDIADDINYDELMYQLSEVQGLGATTEYLSGYSYPGRGEKVFVVAGQVNDEKTNRAVQASTTIQPLVLIIHIISSQSQLMRGDEIESALKAAGLLPGEMHLFHLYEKPQIPDVVMHQQRIFSIVNAAEQGQFDFANMAGLKTPGITMMMQLPGPVEGLFAFERFYNTAKNLASKLGAVLYDVEKNKITKQTINGMKQKIVELDVRLQLDRRPQVH